VLRDASVNKLADFARRSLNKQGLDVPHKVAPLYFIVESLEKVGDAFRDFAKYVDLPASPSLLKLHAKLNQFYRLYYEIFYDFSLKKVDEFLSMEQDLRKQFNQYFEKEKQYIPALHLYSGFTTLFDMNGALMASKL
jgi:hypothetical protein